MTEERAAELIMTARAPWFAEEERRLTFFQDATLETGSGRSKWLR